ncbi:unnamed protein product [Rotaria socialis]|uniref:aralkylamine N-acetyltransferase n=1 Tax=Rotaria socialis TaxID=392032 RepID=A0A817YVJ4_9BILA|nr:unnamed protein product [Rotaria socialis]CAF3632116.1 unnamed protein product [Rotaria socialis]CAF3648477.1 unnamed protein product [Rotaria socialis]CAF3652313.1 unnamed protein product [Rotaria socialis]CAF4428172.1 unnamed protein product [Rotaria socialis]
MTSTSKFAIRLLHEDDYDQVASLLKTSFFPDEPISRCIQITETSEFSNILINSCVSDKCSFVAYDTETNQIVAVCLNEITSKDHHVENNMVSDEKIRFIFQILNDVDRKVKVFERLNANTLLHIYIIAVDKIARGHDLASRLISKSIECVAQEEFNIHGAYAEATNVYSLNCFKKQKFNIFDELIYTDYDSKRLVDLTDPMYDRCYLVGRNF